MFSDISGIIGGGAFPMVLAVLIGASSILALRTGVWPTWLGWAGVVIAIGSLTPVSYIFIAFDLVWVLLMSILIYRWDRAGESVA